MQVEETVMDRIEQDMANMEVDANENINEAWAERQLQNDRNEEHIARRDQAEEGDNRDNRWRDGRNGVEEGDNRDNRRRDGRNGVEDRVTIDGIEESK